MLHARDQNKRLVVVNVATTETLESGHGSNHLREGEMHNLTRCF